MGPRPLPGPGLPAFAQADIVVRGAGVMRGMARAAAALRLLDNATRRWPVRTALLLLVLYAAAGLDRGGY